MVSDCYDIIIIGAGLSGIGAACHLERHCPGKRYAILEGRSRLGGTWDLFRYPGIRSDSDMHTLGYAFRPWRESLAIADGPAILDYLRDTAEEYGLADRILYKHAVTAARWQSEDATWTLDVDTGAPDVPAKLRCRLLLVCAGYYAYEQGYLPEFRGRERFRGQIVHPQHWPRDLDCRDRRVVVIGSGATAVTLVPELARVASHVTMLQRSPTWIISRPDRDRVADVLRRLLPERYAYALTRWKNIRLQHWLYRQTRTRPDRVRRKLLRWIRRELGPDYDVDRHFTPHYDPWDQRLCLVPNGNLFAAIRSGRAAVVTDRIDTFTERGIALESGRELGADIIVTATGLKLVVLGNIAFTVDGRPVDFAETFSYKGIMCSGVPNLVSVFGYINASWTLRADLVARFFCRLVRHMDERGADSVTPVLRPGDRDMPPRPWVEGFSSGYLQRSMAQLPKQGDREPWLNPQDYLGDRPRFLEAPLDDGVLTFAAAGKPGSRRNAPENCDSATIAL